MEKYCPLAEKRKDDGDALIDTRICNLDNISAVLRHLMHRMSQMFTSKIAIRRHFIESQLKGRKSFPWSAWDARGYDQRKMVSVIEYLKVIQEQSDWPNWYFIPDDRFDILCDDYSYEFTSDELFTELSRKYGVVFSNEEIRMIWEQRWSLGQVIDAITLKAREQYCERGHGDIESAG